MPEHPTRAERAIRQTVEQLRAEGIRVPEMTPPKPRILTELGPVMYRVFFGGPETCSVTCFCPATWGP